MAVDSVGNLYLADTFNHRIRFVPAQSGEYFGAQRTEGYIYTVAGTGTQGSVDGEASSAQFSSPTGLTFDERGNLYIAESAGHRVRMWALGSVNPHLANAQLGQIYTIAGTGTAGWSGDSGAPLSGKLNAPGGITWSPR